MKITEITRSPRLRRRVAKGLVGALALVAVAAAMPAAAGGPGRSGDRPHKELWQATGKPEKVRGNAKAQVRTERFRAFGLDRAGMRAALANAPKERTAAARQGGGVVSLPTPRDGEFERFELVETQIMEPKLAARHPDIKTYAGRSLDDPSATIRADLTPLGFHASVRSKGGSYYIDPYYNADEGVYASYFTRDLQAPEAFDQKNPVGDDGHEDDHDHGPDDDHDHGARDGDGMASTAEAATVASGPAVVLRTYRIAIISDPSYANYFGAANVTAAKVTLMNRVNQIYEDESAIRMILVGDTDKTNLDTAALMTGLNGPCGGAPCYTSTVTGCSSAVLTRTRIVLGQLVGASRYDVGHIVLGLNGGGIASLGVVGGNAKAQGCTGLPDPTGDFFAVDYVAHEIGHQFNANHTFNSSVCNSNRSGPNSVEPGSGSSIMAYAGICGTDNLQPHTDPYWSARSMVEINSLVQNARPAINEVQTVSLRGWNTNGQSFRLRYNGVDSAPITRGTNYTTTAIASAITGLTGGTVSVAGFAAGTFNDTGFQVTWSGVNGARNMADLEVVAFTGGASGFVGETAKGGAIDNQGWQITATGNHAPTVSTPMQFTVPVRTPFALTGSATDADGDELTYLWEQIDRGNAATALTNNTKANGPLFRVFGTPLMRPPYVPTQYNSPGGNTVGTDPTRVFPDMEQILVDNTNARTGACPTAVAPIPQTVVDCYSEFLPTAAYTGMTGVNASPARLNFRLTVRDHKPGGGGVGASDTTLVLAPAAGPFRVTSQPLAATVKGLSEQTITWDVAGTDAAPVNTSHVKISLSTDGGRTFPHVLASSTENDGEATVELPNVSTTQARLKVEALGNVYFDVNRADFAIEAVPVATNDAVATRTVEFGRALTPPVTISATDADSNGSALSAEATGLPAGVTLEARAASADGVRPGTRTWTVGGTPTAAPGLYEVEVTVTDDKGGSGVTSFAIEVTDTTAPALTLPATVVRDATAPSGATVTFAATAVDLVDGALVPTCSPASGSTFAIGETTVSCSVTDSRGNTERGTFLVQVRGAAAQLETLNALTLNLGPAGSMHSKVVAAQASLARGDVAATCGQLGALALEARALDGTRHITSAQSADVVTRSTRVRSVVACS